MTMEHNLQMPEIERNWTPPAELTGSREIQLAAGGYASAVAAVPSRPPVALAVVL